MYKGEVQGVMDNGHGCMKEGCRVLWIMDSLDCSLRIFEVLTNFGLEHIRKYII